MNKKDVIRAWKDPVYRASLSPEELAQLPAHPAGVIELGDEQLEARVSGGTTTAPMCTNYTYFNLKYCCPSPTTV
jgi:mersacidin/lichenicidin family type 2 lantibiotic